MTVNQRGVSNYLQRRSATPLHGYDKDKPRVNVAAGKAVTVLDSIERPPSRSKALQTQFGR